MRRSGLVLRKFLSGIYLLTAISIGLGAFGHGSQWSRHVQPALQAVRPEVVSVLSLVWFWVSGAMFVFGALLIWGWWRARRGDTNLAFLPWVVAAFYLIEGVYGGAYLGPFFLLFAVQAVLLVATAWALPARMLRAPVP
jgi:hypothetical protein